MLRIDFEEQPPAEVPTSLPIYATAPLMSPTRDMEAIACAWPGLSLERGTTRRSGPWMSADYGELRLLYQGFSGAVQVSVRSKGGREAQGSTDFPIADDQAARIARELLARVPLVPDDGSTLALEGVSHLVREAASPDGLEPPVILDAGVVFTRVIDETPVIGPGGHVMVKVLPTQAIGGASRVFRPRGARVAATRVMPVSDALEAFEKRLRDSRGLDGAVRVLRAKFGYFEAGRSQRQRVFEPAYAFVFSTDGEAPFKSFEVIPASGSNGGVPGAVTA